MTQKKVNKHVALLNFVAGIFLGYKRLKHVDMLLVLLIFVVFVPMQPTITILVPFDIN